MKMQQLLCFNEIAKTQNFTTAAANLFLSQPSVSYNIRELEKELGVPLLERSFSSAKVNLTPQGEIFLRYVKQILEMVDECELVFRDIKEYRKTMINVACAERLTYGMMPALTKYAAYQLPSGESVILKIRTSMHLQDIESEILNGRVDLAFFPQKPDNDFDYEVINQDELIALVPASHPTANKKTVKLNELADLPVALPPQMESQINDCINKMFEHAQIEPTVYKRGGDIISNRLLAVMINKCYTITSNFPIEISDVAKVRLDTPYNKRDVYAMWKKGRELSQTERYLIDFCKEYKDS